VNIADLTKFLDSRGALIVDGPRLGGMYRAEFGFGGAGGDESRKGRRERPPRPRR
jgi:hypothetical protein